MSEIIIGVDTGNRCIKTPSTTFVAGLKAFDRAPAFRGGLLEYGGKYFVASHDRLAYLQDKTKNDDYFMLTLIAIAKELNCRKIPDDKPVRIHLGVGLPPSHLPRLSERFKTYFLRGAVDFAYNEKPYHIAIDDVTVFAQGYAAIFADFATIKRETTAYIVDMGGYTTDVIALRHGAVDLAFCESLDYGIIQLYNGIGAKIHSAFGRRPCEEQIDDMLSADGEASEMQGIAEREAQTYVDELMRKLLELGVDLTLSKGIFVGGGAARLQTLIEASEYVRKPMFLKDLRANACGYEAFIQAFSKK